MSVNPARQTISLISSAQQIFRLASRNDSVVYQRHLRTKSLTLSSGEMQLGLYGLADEETPGSGPVKTCRTGRGDCRGPQARRAHTLGRNDARKG